MIEDGFSKGEAEKIKHAYQEVCQLVDGRIVNSYLRSCHSDFSVTFFHFMDLIYLREVFVRVNFGVPFILSTLYRGISEDHFFQRSSGFLLMVVLYGALMFVTGPALTAKDISIAPAPYRRIPFVGDLGWRLLVSNKERQKLRLWRRFDKVDNPPFISSIVNLCAVAISSLEQGAFDCKGVSGLMVLALISGGIDPSRIEVFAANGMGNLLIGHFYVVVDRDNDRDASDMATWNGACTIVDPWYPRLFQFNQVPDAKQEEPLNSCCLLLNKCPLLRTDNKDRWGLKDGELSALSKLAKKYQESGEKAVARQLFTSPAGGFFKYVEKLLRRSGQFSGHTSNGPERETVLERLI